MCLSWFQDGLLRSSDIYCHRHPMTPKSARNTTNAKRRDALSSQRHAKPTTKTSYLYLIPPPPLQEMSHRQPTLLPLPMQNPPHPLMLLQEQKRHHRMRAQTHKTRHPPTKHPPHALHPKHPPQQPPQPFLLRRRHDTRLDDIHRTTNRRRHEPGQETGAEMRV